MSTHQLVPQVTPKRRSTPLQISVGLQPAVANLVQIVAGGRGSTASEVVGIAVATLVESARGDSAERAHVIRSTQSYTHQLPAVLMNDDAEDGDRAGRPGPAPQYTERINAYVSRQVLDELDQLCAEAKMSRARMIRLAVDQALFEEMENAGVMTPNKSKLHVTGV